MYCLQCQLRSRNKVHLWKEEWITIPMIYCTCTEILSTFHARVEYISLLKIHSRTPFKQMGRKPAKSFPLSRCGPHIIRSSLGRPRSPPQMANQSSHAHFYKYSTDSPLVTMGRPIFTPKIAPSLDRSPWSSCIFLHVLAFDIRHLS